MPAPQRTPRPTNPPFVIDPNAVFTLEEATAWLNLPRHTLPRAQRAGVLRVAPLAGRYYTTGRWLMAWLRLRERQHRDRREAA